MVKKLLGKKIFIGILITLALLITVSINYAMGVDGPKVRELSLKDATDLAIKNNPDMELAVLSVKRADIEYEGARKIARDISVEDILHPAPSLPTAAQYGISVSKWVTPKSTELALAFAGKSKVQAENVLRSDVEKAYYSVLKSARNLAIKRENLKYFQDQLKIAQTGYKIGTRAKVDVTVAESMVASYQALVVGEENRYRGAVMELNRLTVLPLDTPLKLTTQFSIDKIGTSIKIDETIKNVIENNLTIIGAKNSAAIKKVQAETARKFYGEGATLTTLSDTADVDIKTAEINVRKMELLLTSVIKQSYLSLFSYEQQIDWQIKEVEKAKENARIYAMKYEAGLATSLDAKKATIDMEQAEQNLLETIYQYNQSKLQFKYNLFLSGSTGAPAGS